MNKVFFYGVIVFALAWNSPVYAAPVATTTPVSSVKATVSTSPVPGESTEVQKEEYLLPYPGILPDHPLYFLKSLRDTILESLIVDPARKAEFFLLMADKHLAMSMILSDEGKLSVLGTTLAKDEAYLAKSVGALTTVKQSGKMVSSSTVDRVEKSMVKHQQVFTDLVTKTSDAAIQTAIASAMGSVKKLQQDVAGLK